MKKTLLALPLALAACFAATAQAEPTDLGGGFSLSGNATIVSDYRFRGYSQTDFRPAAQLGFDLTHSSGFYLGNWNSNVSSFVFTDGNLEMDFYGGWKGDVGGGFTLDAGVLHYYYPGSSSPKGGNYNNTDIYLGASYGNYSLKYSYTPSDFFSTPDSKGTWYLDGTATFDLGDGWGLLGHLGYQKLKNQTNMDGDSIGHYVDYKVGVTKDLKGWILGLAAVGATKDNWLPTKYGHPSGRIGAVFSVARAF
ncbi:TorF family putative porin [Achromobacter deleyi]|uniref:TorF family putative porin n=1 Tax=Achromobacter deleyi TaxID=1353891 RepID=UPI001492458B|nr:TorF family putative porin [Achromobacter deleyi]QVQ27963.1 TorF family putative porin [Achromobacter deleyi]UIP23575.1 TorF family putative porin [Achromobacter deleyi]